MQLHSEQERLNNVAADSWYAEGVPTAMIQHCSKVFARYFRGRRCLELGPAEGILSDHLAQFFPDLTLVDGAEIFCERLRARLPKAHVVQVLFEEFKPEGLYDTIVLGHVLEHVEHPAELLTRVKTWLAPAGVVCCAVPNARSIHRQAAVILNLLPTEHSLNAADIHHGHRRVYDPETFRAEFLKAGFQIDVFGGYWLKPLSNGQIEKHWTPAMLNAFMQLGERYPDIAAEIYVVASVPGSS